MPYDVNFTDSDTKSPITVYDNTSNTDTSIVFPGRNVTGYGQIIAENFLRLLENFASPQQPVNPVEGQLWYNSSTGTLNIYDNVSWKSSSGIQKSPTAPSVSEDKLGEVWVDTVKQQLYVWSGATWVLVGPEFSTESGLRTGPVIETVNDSDNNSRRIVKFLVEEVPVAIISKDSFTPKITISGFDTIRAGLNIANPNDESELGNFLGGFLPKLTGVSTSSDALNVGDTTVAASKFLRSDVVNTTEFGLNVRNNSGITLGADGNFRISTTITSARIYNGNPGSSIDLQVNREGIASTTLRILDDKVGIGVLSPQQALDVDGNIQATGTLISLNADPSTNLNNGSIRTAGGVAITKNLLVGSNLNVFDTATLRDTLPETTENYDLGSTSKRWDNVYAKTLIADTLITEVIDGDLAGNARTATNLRSATSFSLSGDVISTNTVQFDGAVGGTSKQFLTELTANIISGKDQPFPNFSSENDFVLVFREGTGLLKESRDVFVGDLGIPIGTILPFAGVNVPRGYLLCDGSEVERRKFRDLYDTIGNTFGATSIGADTFKLPDLRGRFPLGRDNMDNGGQVPDEQGGLFDAGGGPANRVSGTEAASVGQGGGSSAKVLELINLPDHQHDLQGPGGQPFNAIRLDPATIPGVAPGPGPGPTAPGQAQYLNDSGGIKTTATLGQAFSVMNPFLTINYIIRSGPPAF
jgi:microcystin-dependent protein